MLEVHRRYIAFTQFERWKLRQFDSAETGEDVYLTKGDNNNVDDRYIESHYDYLLTLITLLWRRCRGLYAENQLWLNRTDIIGVVNGYAANLSLLAVF